MDISFIIPCFNSGRLLEDALLSIERCNLNCTYEVIVIDDGSTQELTLDILAGLNKSGVPIIRQENRGPGSARNAGVMQSTGEFLFFLDSDNLVRPNYLKKGLLVLKTDISIGVVYAKAQFFGDSNEPRFGSQAFDEYQIIMRNTIDTCALVRRRAWQQVGGFDESEVLRGYEDWDFWLSLCSAGWKFHYLAEVAFDYRINNSSLIMQKKAPENRKRVEQYLHLKHIEFFQRQYAKLYNLNLYRKKHPFKNFIKTLLNKV